MEHITVLFRRIVEILFVLAPLGLVAYLSRYQQPPLILHSHVLHEVTIGVACGLGAVVSAVALKAYFRTGEYFARYLVLGFAGFTALYFFHGLLTRLEEHNFWLFILFGPMSRLVLAAFVTMGIFGYTRPREPLHSRMAWRHWLAPIIVITAAGAVSLTFAYSAYAGDPMVRWVLEGATVLLCLSSILRLSWRHTPFGMKPYLLIGLTLTAQSSLAFLLTPAWTHLWWLAHLIGAAGFLSMSYGVARSGLFGWSLNRLLSEDEMLAQLDLANAVGKALRKAKDEAEAASRSKSEFLASMSHELRTPLNAIIGFSDMMHAKTHGPLGAARYEEYTALIGDSGRHLLALINDVLDVSRIDAGTMELNEETVDLGAVVASAITMVQGRADKSQISVAAHPTPNLPHLHADARRVKQIMLNLLSNAVKFSEPGGTVRVDFSRAADGGMVLIVSDTGIGMSAAEIPHALTVFGQVDSRLERRFEGTGLGLPLTRAMMELHGGTLTIDSALGQGTRVSVTFPARRVLEPATPAGSA